MRMSAMLLCLFALPAGAETVEGLFGKGFHNVAWGASQARARAVFPGGATCRWNAEDGSYFIYSVQFKQDPLGMGIRDVRVSFQFTPDDRLQAIRVHYPYSARDDVLYRVAELLGQNYLSDESDGLTAHVWNSPRELIAAVQIFAGRRMQWAIFQIRADRLVEHLQRTAQK